VRRHYHPGTLVLETEFETATCAVILDFMRLVEGGELRIVAGRTGSVTLHTELVARFNYGASVP
jgi:hypothetical protein